MEDLIELNEEVPFSSSAHFTDRHCCTTGGTQLPVYHFRSNSRLILGEQYLDDNLHIPQTLVNQRQYLEQQVLPAVGILVVHYPTQSEPYFATGFVCSPPTEQPQRIVTAFNNVKPNKKQDEVTREVTLEWPQLFFSTDYDGSRQRYDAFKRGLHSVSGDEQPYCVLNFSNEFLQQSQGVEGVSQVDKMTEGFIELVLDETAPKFPTWVEASNLKTVPVPKQKEEIIVVGYPAQRKSVSYGYFLEGYSKPHSFTYKASTEQQNCGSPILRLSDASVAEAIGMHTQCFPQNYNVGLFFSAGKII